MLASAKGILAIWHDVVDGAEHEIFDWYDREHHLERMAIDGFLSAQRYVSVHGRSPLLFNRYETSSLDVFTSDAYRICLASPTEWSRRCQPLYRNMSRTVCRVVARTGVAQGVFVATYRIPQDAIRHLQEPAFQEIVARHRHQWGLVGFELWQAESAVSNVASTERELRGRDDDVIGGALVVHATASEALDKFAVDIKRELEAATECHVAASIHRLMFSAYSQAI